MLKHAGCGQLRLRADSATKTAAKAPKITVLDLDPPLAALNRLLAIAQGDTGQARKVANFLLAWSNAADCGGFDLTDLWGLDRGIAGDILSVIRLIALRHNYPDIYGLHEPFERLVADWRPHLVPHRRPAMPDPGRRRAARPPAFSGRSGRRACL